MPKASSAEKPWERQNGESEKAFEAFTTYRDMGEKRTLIAVAERLQKSYTLVRRWKDRWEWERRCLEYDNELQRAAKKAATDELRAMNKRQIKIALQLQELALQAMASTDPKDIDPKNIVAFIKAATELERNNREAEASAVSAEVQKTAAEGPSTLADAITEAWRRRKDVK